MDSEDIQDGTVNSKSKHNNQGFRRNQIVVLVLIWVGIIISISVLSMNQKDWNATLSFISILIAIGTLIFTILYERFQTDNELKDRIYRALETLQNDVKHIKEGFEIKDKKLTKGGYEYEKSKILHIHLTYIQIGTEVYDSILSSGLFTYFQKESQLTLGKFYFNCKLHNKQLSEKRRFEYEHKLGYDSKVDLMYRQLNLELARRLTDYEGVVTGLIPKLQHYLNEEIKKAKSSRYKIREYEPTTKPLEGQGNPSTVLTEILSEKLRNSYLEYLEPSN